MAEITITTYDQSPKNRVKQRKAKIDIDVDTNNILALTTARGNTSKWPKLYISDYVEPLELPDQRFEDLKNRLIEATQSDSKDKSPIFIPVGTKVLVNYNKVARVDKLYRKIVLIDDRVIDDIDEQSLADFESLFETIKQKEKEQRDNYTRRFWENVVRVNKEVALKNEHKFIKLNGTIEESMGLIFLTMVINFILTLVLIILTGIILYKL